MRMFAIGFSFWLGMCCLAAEEIANQDSDSPEAVVDRWFSYFDKDKIEKYVEEALLKSEIEKLGSSPDAMTKQCRANKEFFIAILSAMKSHMNISILDSNKNKVAVFYFKATVRGYNAASLKWFDGRWIVHNMYKPGQPVATFDP